MAFHDNFLKTWQLETFCGLTLWWSSRSQAEKQFLDLRSTEKNCFLSIFSLYWSKTWTNLKELLPQLPGLQTTDNFFKPRAIWPGRCKTGSRQLSATKKVKPSWGQLCSPLLNISEQLLGVAEQTASGQKWVCGLRTFLNLAWRWGVPVLYVLFFFLLFNICPLPFRLVLLLPLLPSAQPSPPGLRHVDIKKDRVQV